MNVFDAITAVPVHQPAHDGDANVRSAERGIAFICHPYHRGGVTRWMADAALECARRGVPVWFVCPEPTHCLSGRDARPTVLSLLGAPAGSSALSLHAPCVGVAFELGTYAYRRAWYAQAIWDGIPSGVPVIVSDDPAVWDGSACAAPRNPVIGVLHADDAAYFDLAVRFGRSVSALVCVSRRIAKAASAILCEPAPPVYTIPCGIPLTAYAPSPRCTGRELRLVWAGRIDERQKRVSDLVRIASAIRNRGITLTLTIIGDGPDRALVERLVADRAWQGVVTMLGWQPPRVVAEHLAASDILLLPSNFEGMPIVAMEALASGCGVVASRVSGLEDYESHPSANGALALFAVGDCEDAAEQTLALAAMPRDVRAGRARRLAEEVFSIGECVDQYLAIVRFVEREPANLPRPVRPLIERTGSHAVAALRYTRLRLSRRGAARHG